MKKGLYWEAAKAKPVASASISLKIAMSHICLSICLFFIQPVLQGCTDLHYIFWRYFLNMKVAFYKKLDPATLAEQNIKSHRTLHEQSRSF